MNQIKVKKSELIAVLRRNRDGHRAIFEEALAGYKQRVIEELQKRLDAALAGKSWDTAILLQQPEDHTKDYSTAIQMLEMDVDDEVSVNNIEFRQFVQDEWGWTDRFLLSNSAYSARAARGLADRNTNTF